ncbi:MAG: flagellar basal-body rod protein FlgF [Cellulosilyticaceae bacterium]
MIRGLYVAATGMNVQSKKMDIISNDLANVNTTGYKKDQVVIGSFPELLTYRIQDKQNNMPNDAPIGRMTFGAKIDDVVTQFVQGSLVKTDGMMDVALHGPGFFTVQTPNGQMYTRDGSFVINAGGDLLTQEGYQVMGQGGPINLGADFLGTGEELIITAEGEIRSGQEVIDTLDIACFADEKSLTKTGDNLYTGGSARIPFEGSMSQGFIEASNVNPVTAMVDMITVSRAYEANQKMIQVHDSLLGKAVNEVGRV